ncbi:MAG TPA: BTAD domain-containing putative transcriptional regulator [Pilimelia sp.]|nr:BTAD domain-containing putative transcriptional regulator [Pilimelia sp.]
MRLRCLGPMELAGADGRPLPIGTPRRKALLGFLLWHANETVSRTAIIEALWGGAPPSTASAQIHSDISALRRTLRGAEGKCRIQSRALGYAFEITADESDYLEFRHLVDLGRSASDPERAAASLRAALRLWRGEAFGDVRAPYVHGSRVYLSEQRLLAYELVTDLDLALGRHADLVPELSAVVADHPLRERPRAQLMVALHRCGRTAEALASARELRKLLADEQGLDPGGTIVELEHRLLRGEDPPQSQGGLHRPVPAELPVAPGLLVGRQREMDELDRLPEKTATAAAVMVIAGSPGVGKTTLAIHWGHSNVRRFPDGQLYANLRGFDPVGAPMLPSEALRGFLLALGVAPYGVPASVDEQAALYRTMLRGRRVLVVLDNARDEHQVRPLLPGSAGCGVLITSRRTLTGLVATAGAQIIRLGQLSTAEARELIERRLGRERTAAEPQAMEIVVESCARLPLALSVAASRALARPHLTLRSLAHELRAPDGSLDALASADAMTDVRSVFAASYRGLSPAAAEVFRLLSLHTGPNIAESAAAHLAGTPCVRQALHELVYANLITEDQPHRYAYHDLLRAYATELAAADPAEKRTAAQRRLIEYYMRTADSAATMVNAHQIRPSASASATATAIGDGDQAKAWFAAEHKNLLAATAQAADLGLDVQAYSLAAAVSTYFDLYGHWHDWIRLQEIAVEAAGRLADGTRLGHAYHSLAIACNKLGRHADTDTHIVAAIRTFTGVGDLIGQAHALCARSRILFGRRERPAQALNDAERALALFVARGDLVGQATAHNSISGILHDLGRLEPAWQHARDALRLFQQLGDGRSEADAWDSVGYVHQGRGEHDAAIRCFQQAHELWASANDRLGEAVALRRIGDSLDALGDPAACTRWAEALQILEELRHPGAVPLRALVNKTTV